MFAADKYNGKELDAETGLYYYGARYYDSRLAMWYGVDALAEKYPNMGGYVYCAGNPVRLVDVDGNEVKVFMAKASGCCGIGVGISGSIFRGTAHDDFGVTHFSGTSYMVGTIDGGIFGVDINVGLQFAYDSYYSSFYDYSDNSFAANAPIQIHGNYGGGIGYLAHSEDKLDGIVIDAGIGRGLSLSFGNDNTNFHEAISVSYNEANIINGDSFLSTTWHVNNVKLNYSEEEGLIYTGYVNGKVKVSSKAIVQDDKIRPSNIWMSQEYLNNKSQDGK